MAFLTASLLKFFCIKAAWTNYVNVAADLDQQNMLPIPTYVWDGESRGLD